ncbi:dual specificity protein phosphatase 14-like [Sinocyclocheilus grahami]|uniref:dual specificity protein phosphatase 14-like n=1 Tax=Sinocyclocheilus grahami TaxID=75366 RepID=UPI0007AC9D48|nr:PREDICTED: dual specificity protein phosphatase 14-like [Sinocyclocheilus grahami]
MISQITPSLYLSGVEAVNQSVLEHRGITLLVNACAEYPCLEYQGVRCVWVPVEDRPHAPLEQHFDSVAEQIQQNHTGSTLVFCSAGRSRSPSLIMAYLMRFEGLSLLQAHQRVLAARPFIRPNAGFWRQLLQYERKLTHSNSIRIVTAAPFWRSVVCKPKAIVARNEKLAIKDEKPWENPGYTRGPVLL